MEDNLEDSEGEERKPMKSHIICTTAGIKPSIPLISALRITA
jgi:hypothetical protein